MVSSQSSEQFLQLETPSLGLVQYTESQCYTCASGVLGFPEQHEFILIDDNKVQPFRWLICKNLVELAFLIIDPGLVHPGHELQLQRSELSDLELENEDQHAIYVIASVQKSPQDTTLNFRGPLVFNLSKRLFQQVIDEKQELKVPLFSS